MRRSQGHDKHRGLLGKRFCCVPQRCWPVPGRGGARPFHRASDAESDPVLQPAHSQLAASGLGGASPHCGALFPMCWQAASPWRFPGLPEGRSSTAASIPDFRPAGERGGKSRLLARLLPAALALASSARTSSPAEHGTRLCEVGFFSHWFESLDPKLTSPLRGDAGSSRISGNPCSMYTCHCPLMSQEGHS